VRSSRLNLAVAISAIHQIKDFCSLTGLGSPETSFSGIMGGVGYSWRIGVMVQKKIEY
jgi:hypothetical protein